MARGWKCPRCSTQNGEGIMNCSKCGLLQGSVYVPGAYLALPGREPGEVSAPAEPPEAPVSGLVEPAPWAAAERSALPSAAQGVGAPLLIGDESQTTSGWVPPYPISPPPSRPIWRRIPVGLLIFGVLVVGGAVAGFITNASRSSTGDISKSGDLSSSDLRIGDCWDLKDPNADTVDNVAAKPCTEPHEYEVFYVGPMDGVNYPTDDQFTTYVENNCLPAFTTYVGKVYDDSNLEITWLNPIAEGWTQGDRAVACSVYDPENSAITVSLRSSNR